MNARRTGKDYMKVEHGSRKWYQTIFESYFGRLRVSRRRFGRASETEEYREEVLKRLGRIKNERRHL